MKKLRIPKNFFIVEVEKPYEDTVTVNGMEFKINITYEPLKHARQYGIVYKVPDWLPSIKPDRDDDGNVVFIGQEGIGRLTRKIIKHKPEVGDMFVFPSHLFHTVYPFKTDGDYERRSCSFNADFINKAEYEQQQEMMKQQQQPPPAPLQGAPEKLTINTEE